MASVATGAGVEEDGALTRKEFCKLLKEAIADESKAQGKDYPKLLRASKHAGLPSYTTKGFGSIVREIMGDEGDHHFKLKNAYYAICRVKR